MFIKKLDIKQVIKTVLVKTNVDGSNTILIIDATQAPKIDEMDPMTDAAMPAMCPIGSIAIALRLAILKPH